MLQHAIRWYDLVLFVLSLIDSEEIQAVVHRHLFRCYLSVNTPKALEYLTFSEKNSTSTCNLVCRFEYLISCELYVEGIK